MNRKLVDLRVGISLSDHVVEQNKNVFVYYEFITGFIDCKINEVTIETVESSLMGSQEYELLLILGCCFV